jgi:hypothetical protein
MPEDLGSGPQHPRPIFFESDPTAWLEAEMERRGEEVFSDREAEAVPARHVARLALAAAGHVAAVAVHAEAAVALVAARAGDALGLAVLAVQAGGHARVRRAPRPPPRRRRPHRARAPAALRGAGTLFGAFVLQAAALLALYSSKGGAAWPVLMPILALVGANYGANLALFPASAKEFFGLKNFGMNYGVLFSAWGMAGLVMPWVNGKITDLTGSGDLTYSIIIALLCLGAALTFVSRRLAAARPAAALAGA